MQRASSLTFLLLSSLVGTSALGHDGDPKARSRQPIRPGPGWQNHQRLPGSTGGLSGIPTGSAGLAAGPSFPSSNVTLFSWLSLSDLAQPSNGNGNSCFGYTSPSGREYAIMGLYTGTAFVEITQPGSPVIVANLAGPQSLWRDMRVYSHYCYAISEGGGGIQVFDMANIDSGVVATLPSVTTGGGLATHSLALNTDSGYLYRAGGGSSGIRIYNLNSNPAAPVYVGQWSARYVHECQVVSYPTGGPGGGPRELAICCGGLNGGFTDTGIDVIDVTNHAAPVSVGHFTYGSANFSHQAWLSPDRQTMYHNDETDGRPFTRVFNAANLNAPVPSLTYIGEFQSTTAIDHNIYTKGTYIYEANYRTGLRVFDTSSGVTTPTLVGYYDTYPEDDSSADYNGLWNNYPYFPSGVVIGSDIERGLFVWWVGTPPISIAFIGAPPSLVSPAGQTFDIQVTENTAGSLVPGSVQMFYSTGGSYTSAPATALGGNQFAAALPPTACGSTVSYYFAAETTNGIIWSYPTGAPAEVFTAVSAFNVAITVADDFQTAAGAWTGTAAGDTATAGLWTRVDPNGTAAQSEDDHTVAPGTNCWVTGQGAAGGSIGSADVDGGRTTLTSATLNLTGLADPRISYWRWYSNDQNGVIDDTFRVDVSNNNGSTWTNVETIGPAGAGTTGGWFFHEFAVSSFVAPTAQVRIRFIAEDVGTGSIVEAAIDDFQVRDLQCSGYGTYCFGDGSGTPCPCANNGMAGQGCANSTGSGASLTPGGTASVSADTFSITSSSTPAVVSVLFFQGTAAQNGGAGSVFGDGLRCASGSIIRLGTKVSSAGSSSYPQGGDATISVRGSVSVGQTRTYQAWYRNAAAFCSPDTFNLTNGVSATWGP